MKLLHIESEKKLRIVLSSLFFVYVFIMFTKPILDADTPWHLKTGDYIFNNKIIPTEDPFSFAKDSVPIRDFILSQYWLSQIVFFIMYDALGTFGLVITGAFIFTLIVFLLFSSLKNKGLYFSLFVIAGFTLPILRDFVAIRPQIFTFLFTALLVFLFENYKEKRSFKYLYSIPLLMILWSNMHGGFIYGVILICIYSFSESITYFYKWVKKNQTDKTRVNENILVFLGVCVVAVLVSAINPNGYEAFLIAYRAYYENTNLFIYEHLSPLQALSGSPSISLYIFLLVQPLVAILIILFLKKGNIGSLLLLLFSLSLAFFSVRYIALFAIIATFLLREFPSRKEIKLPVKANHILNISIIILLIFLVISSNPYKSEKLYKFNDSAFYPVQAARFLGENGIHGNIYSSYNKSAFLSLKLFPASRVYSDARIVSIERLMLSSEIDGELISMKQRIETINAVLPEDIGTITIEEYDTKKTSRIDNFLKLRAHIVKNRTWKELLEEIKAEIIVHEAVNMYTGKIYPLVFRLIQDDSWKIIYADGNVLIFLKNMKKFKNALQKYEKPNELVYDEIISECFMNIEKNSAELYANIALALLLKGQVNSEPLFYIEKALSIDSQNVIAFYSEAIYALMKKRISK